MASAVVSGSKIAGALLTSPVIMGIIAIAVVLLLVRARRGPRLPFLGDTPGAGRAKRIIVGLMLSMIVLLIAAIVALTVDPRLEYGAWTSDGKLVVRFYQNDTVEVDICDIEYVGLVTVDEALNMLKYRTNGVADPGSGVYMGYYKTIDGQDAYVLILAEESGDVLVFRLSDGSYVMIGVPDIEGLFEEVADYHLSNCTP
ncbi:MAG: hypothetical protein GSR78_01865 [Desulfurococcales archaeon]|nr:hypothetical protein [Desulfurococcales archaeon]